jgi:hypothetical protein
VGGCRFHHRNLPLPLLAPVGALAASFATGQMKMRKDNKIAAKTIKELTKTLQ